MNLETFFEKFDQFADAPDAVAKMRELVLQLAVQGRLVQQDRTEDSASVLLKRIRAARAELPRNRRSIDETDIAELEEEFTPFAAPSGWKWTTLGNVQVFTNGYAFKSEDYQSSGVGIIRMGELGANGEIDERNMKYVTTDIAQSLPETFRVRPGDLLMGMSGSIGKLAINRSDKTYLLNQRVGRLANCAKMFVTGEGHGLRGRKGRCAKSPVTVANMDKSMSSGTRQEVLGKLRGRYQSAGAEYRRKLIDQAVELLGYHRKSAIRALSFKGAEPRGRTNTGRPARYDARTLTPWLKQIWQATDYACSRRLAAMLPEWIPAFEAHERSMPREVRERLLLASARTLDRLLEPLRGQASRRSLTRPGSLLRQQIPIRGSMWEENKAGWLEVDTVALCGGSVGGEFVWMLDGVDYATGWVEVRAMWGRGQAGTLEALKDVENRLPFPLLGLDSDNGGEFLNHHVLGWLQKRERPVFMTRSRPYKKDDNAHVEQKNWTHIRQWFGYERHDNPEVVERINELTRGPYGQLLNFYHACLKLEGKERRKDRLVRIYGAPRTPLARVLESAQVTLETKGRLVVEKARLNPFALKREIEAGLKQIARMRQLDA